MHRTQRKDKGEACYTFKQNNGTTEFIASNNKQNNDEITQQNRQSVITQEEFPHFSLYRPKVHIDIDKSTEAALRLCISHASVPANT